MTSPNCTAYLLRHGPPYTSLLERYSLANLTENECFLALSAHASAAYHSHLIISFVFLFCIMATRTGIYTSTLIWGHISYYCRSISHYLRACWSGSDEMSSFGAIWYWPANQIHQEQVLEAYSRLMGETRINSAISMLVERFVMTTVTRFLCIKVFVKTSSFQLYVRLVHCLIPVILTSATEVITWSQHTYRR